MVDTHRTAAVFCRAFKKVLKEHAAANFIVNKDSA